MTLIAEDTYEVSRQTFVVQVDEGSSHEPLRNNSIGRRKTARWLTCSSKRSNIVPRLGSLEMGAHFRVLRRSLPVAIASCQMISTVVRMYKGEAV